MHFIVKLFPEITIKSPPVRKRFTKHLRENLKYLLADVGAPIEVIREWDKIDVISPSEDPLVAARVAEVLAHTPGIAHFSKVRNHPLGDLDDIYQKTHEIWAEALAGKTFCVRVKRSGNHEFTSTDVERYVGGGLNQYSEALGVRLKNPDITVMLEIRGDQLYVIEEQIAGLGGFPLGSQDPVLSLISGGFDSTVSSYLTIKRGIRTHYCFFNLGGRAHEVAVKEVAYYLWRKFGASHRVMFVTVPFEDVVTEILEKVHNSQMGVVLKRMMMRAASKVAEEMEIQALVTGEAIAQVSSQTLTNLSVIDGVTDTLTLRPLITMDKGDIIDIAREIGTEDFSASIPEYCGVISRKPTTRAKVERIEAEEANFDFAVLDNAVEARKMQHIDGVINDLQDDEQVALVASVEAGQVVIDVRHPDEEELSPLTLDGVEVLKIPFYRLSSAFAGLDKAVEYLLYCDKGVMSQLHAANLKAEGYRNLGVYRPE
ncbi:MAG: tRNA 4-thiouridine(8) synthase ThiI [Candidatus Pelagadaptatus aseana]|uniref:tRNA uracil 4-sulfurtransferase ThiI n=1 Tax=Candidatus Pelagadaptatus aseana TaxID=3120508 RepID=UPI0039B32D3F